MAIMNGSSIADYQRPLGIPTAVDGNFTAFLGYSLYLYKAFHLKFFKFILPCFAQILQNLFNSVP